MVFVISQVCVKECPTEAWSYTYASTIRQSEAEMKEKLICRYGVDKSKYTVAELVDAKKQLCASYILPSKSSEFPVWICRRYSQEFVLEEIIE